MAEAGYRQPSLAVGTDDFDLTDVVAQVALDMHPCKEQVGISRWQFGEQMESTR
jgi:hypothetical protein